MSSEALDAQAADAVDPGLDGAQRELCAFVTLPSAGVRITPAPRWREWMNATDQRWANRCLPLLVANESGWTLLNPLPFTATWTGDDSAASLAIEFDGEIRPRQGLVESVFGYGILTWRVPFLFRTAPGWNTLARGPANWPKDGISALEGVVETDWMDSTFTMNWKLTRAAHPVRFEKDEPFCMIVPHQRGDLASFSPELRDLESSSELAEAARLGAQRRRDLRVRKFLGLYSKDFEEARYEWQGDYFKGLRADGTAAPAHEKRLGLRPFVDRRP